MLVHPLEFSRVNSYWNTLLYIEKNPCGGTLPTIVSSILNTPIQENPVITPSNNTTVVRPSMIGRTLGTVTVLNQTPLYFTVNITGTASDSVSVKNASTAVSSDTAVATVTVSGTNVVITGVAAGTSVISVFDAEKNLLASIYTTVVA
jgi:hypothetical protein